MILVTHAIIGAALAGNAPNVAVAGAIGIASHYLLDMIPHWHYGRKDLIRDIRESKPKEKLLLDRRYIFFTAQIAVDFFSGLGLAYILLSGNPTYVLLGAFTAMVPDLLNAAGKLFPGQILLWHTRFHSWVHTKHHLDDTTIFGIGSQAAFAMVFIYLF